MAINCSDFVLDFNRELIFKNFELNNERIYILVIYPKNFIYAFLIFF